MIGKGVVTDFVLSWEDDHRKETLRKYPDVDDYINNFTLSDKDLLRLREMGEKQKVKADDAMFERSREQMLLLIRALIARDLWNSTAYFRIINEKAPVFRKALGILKDPEAYQKVLSGK
jgi:carboxyl-terminal processing protease